DSIEIEFEYDGEDFILIDTAGVRRKGKVNETVEKFSVVKTLQSISDSNVVILVVDAKQGISTQDAHLLGYIVDAGKALLIAVNKWDGLAPGEKEQVKKELDRKLTFVDYASVHTISALHGSGVGHLMGVVRQCHKSAFIQFSTSVLTKILEDALTAHPPPLVNNRRIKLRYAHQGGKNPPRIIIHGNQTDKVPDSYKRYLSNSYRTALKLEGTPVHIGFKSGDNPYKDRKNKLTPTQVRKRKRMMKHVKK
ncbi:MAG: GTP-binding protein, partial [Gammaproteobacteria bacterium]|nr:GTP-binding protein [Gammaproteobacteria bacterium]